MQRPYVSQAAGERQGGCNPCASSPGPFCCPVLNSKPGLPEWPLSTEKTEAQKGKDDAYSQGPGTQKRKPSLLLPLCSQASLIHPSLAAWAAGKDISSKHSSKYCIPPRPVFGYSFSKHLSSPSLVLRTTYCANIFPVSSQKALSQRFLMFCFFWVLSAHFHRIPCSTWYWQTPPKAQRSPAPCSLLNTDNHPAAGCFLFGNTAALNEFLFFAKYKQ